jgi:hypothetical protein
VCTTYHARYQASGLSITVIIIIIITIGCATAILVSCLFVAAWSLRKARIVVRKDALDPDVKQNTKKAKLEPVREKKCGATLGLPLEYDVDETQGGVQLSPVPKPIPVAVQPGGEAAKNRVLAEAALPAKPPQWESIVEGEVVTCSLYRPTYELLPVTIPPVRNVIPVTVPPTSPSSSTSPAKGQSPPDQLDRDRALSPKAEAKLAAPARGELASFDSAELTCSEEIQCDLYRPT